MASFEVSLAGADLSVDPGETMAGVKQRMAAQAELTAVQISVLLGAGAHSSNDGRTVRDAGVLVPGASIALPYLAGSVQCRYGGKGAFEAAHLELAKGRLTFRAKEGGKTLREASVVGCQLEPPRTAHAGCEFAFVLALAEKDSAKSSAHTIGLADAKELVNWTNAVGAYGQMTQYDIRAVQKDARALASRALAGRLQPGEDGASEVDEEPEVEAGSFSIMLDGKEFGVVERETMGDVTRRMAVSTGLTPGQLGKVLGSSDDSETVGTAGLLTVDTCIQLPQCGGSVECLFHGKRTAEAVYVELSKGKIVFRASSAAADVLRTASALGCCVAVPAKPRAGASHCFRIDLAKRDTEGNDKYLMIVPDADGVSHWMDAIGAYSMMSLDDIEQKKEEATEYAARAASVEEEVVIYAASGEALEVVLAESSLNAGGEKALSGIVAADLDDLSSQLQAELGLDLGVAVKLQRYDATFGEFITIGTLDDCCNPCTVKVADEQPDDLEVLKDQMDEAIGLNDIAVVSAAIDAATAWPEPSELEPAHARLQAYAGQLEAATRSTVAEEDEDQILIVECPEGMSPGGALLVETEDGQEVEACVPEGILPGQEFEVRVQSAATQQRIKEQEGKAAVAAENKKKAKAKAKAASKGSPKQKKKKPKKSAAASPEESPAAAAADANGDGEVQSGQVWVQCAADAEFAPYWAELSGSALSFKCHSSDSGFVRIASVDRCSVLVPKTPRHARPNAFRIDLAAKDSLGDEKYIVAVSHFSELQGWLMALSDACVEGVDETLAVLQERGLDALDGSNPTDPDAPAPIIIKDKVFSLTVQKNYVVKKATSVQLEALVLAELEMRLQTKLGMADKIKIDLYDEDFGAKSPVLTLDDLPAVCQIAVQLGEKVSRSRGSGRKIDPEQQRMRARHEIMALKEKQLLSMEQEDYENCALLRDAMKQLEDGLSEAEAVVTSKKRSGGAGGGGGEPLEGGEAQELAGDVAKFERLAKPLLPDADKSASRNSFNKPSRVLGGGGSPRGSPRGGRARAGSPQRPAGGSPSRVRATSPVLDASVSALVADLPTPSARTSRSAAPFSKIQQDTLTRLGYAIETLTKNLRSLSYDHGGQNAEKLFRLFDIRRMERLTVKEFTASVRKGGKIKIQQMNVGEVNELFRVIDLSGDGFLTCDEFASFVWRASSDVLASDVIAGVDSTGRPRKKKGEGGGASGGQRKLREGFDNGADAHKQRLLSPPRRARPHLISKDGTRPMMDPLDWTGASGSTGEKYLATQGGLYGSHKRKHSENPKDRQRSLRVQALVSPPRSARGARRAAVEAGVAAEYHGTETRNPGYATPKKAEWRAKTPGGSGRSAGGGWDGGEDKAASIARKKKQRQAAKEKDAEWLAKVDRYNTVKKEREQLRAQAKVNLDKQRLAIDPVHNPRFIHRTKKTEAELEGRFSRLSSPLGKTGRTADGEAKMQNTIRTIEKAHEEAMQQHSKTVRISKKKAAEVGTKLMLQGTVEPRSRRTRPEQYEEIRKQKGLNEHSLRLTSPPRSGSGSQSFSSLADVAIAASGGVKSSRSPPRQREGARSPQLSKFLARQQEAIDLQRANLLQKKARLLEEERAIMNSSKLAANVGKADRQRALKLASPPRSQTTPRQSYDRDQTRRSPQRQSAGSPRRSGGGRGGGPQRTDSGLNRSAQSQRSPSGAASPKVAVAGEVIMSPAGTTEGGAAVPVAKARIRKVDSSGGSPVAVTGQPVGSWAASYTPEEETSGDLAAAAARARSPREMQESVEARVAAAVASVSGSASPSTADKRFALPGREERISVFDRFDANGNGGLSLAEIDKAVLELWPQYDHKRALMRAYKAADTNNDGFIKRREFRALLMYIVYFNGLWDTFEAIDSNHDHRLNKEEFATGCQELGMQLTTQEVNDQFSLMDENGGGFVLFDEFCVWCAASTVTAEVEEIEAAVTAAVEAEEQSRNAAGGGSDEKPLAAVAAVVEAEILADDGVISPKAARTAEPEAAEDDEFVSVVCPEGLAAGDVIVISHPTTGSDIEGEVPQGVSPGDEFEIFIG